MYDVITPALHSSHRMLFEHAFQRDHEDQLRLLSVGGQLEGVGELLAARYDPYEPDATIERYDTLYKEPLSEYIASQRQHLEESTAGTNATRRQLGLYGNLADQIILLPLLFGSVDTTHLSDLRRKLVAVDGIYGQIVEILQEAYVDYMGEGDTVEMEQRHSAGQLTELTTLALANRAQSPGFFALPTLPAEDQLGKVDATFYFKTKQANFSKVQVKTTEQRVHMNSGKIRLVGGIALGNSDKSSIWDNPETPMQTSRAIIDETNGFISDNDARILDYLARSLMTSIRAQRSFAAPQDKTTR